MPIKRTKAPEKLRRKKTTGTGADQREPVISQDEKRRMIMAHAVMRPTRDPVQLMSMWAGVLVAVLAVAAGWWWSVGSTVAGSYKTANIMEDIKNLGREEGVKSEMRTELEKTGERLRAMREQAQAQSALLQADLMEDASSTEVFVPSPTTTSPATTTTGTIEQAQ